MIMTSKYNNINCKVEGCNNPAIIKFFCNRHYNQFLTYGKILKRTCIDKNEIIIEGDIAKIFLYNRKREKIYETIIDKNQIDKVKNYIWSYHSCLSNKHLYAYNNKIGSLHRFLLNLNKNEKPIVDHKNGNTLDNRLSNIRICTHEQNCRNRVKRKNNKSGYKGVYWNKERSLWESSIKFKGKNILIGRFKTKEEAKKKYEKKVNELHENFSIFNSRG